MQQVELQIVCAKIMPPLGHAVRFVDRKQRQFSLFQQMQSARLGQPFGRDIQKVENPFDELLFDGSDLVC